MPTTIGPYRPDPKGQHSPDEEYSLLDWVTDSGNSYLYINPEPSTGTALTNETYWLKTAGKGDQGDQGIQGEIGISGMQIGSDEPEDPGIQIWVDPNASADFDPVDFEQRLAALEALHPE